ncbi:MAG: Tfp pilus assembly protein PilE [Phycisphaerales bacterium]
MARSVRGGFGLIDLMVSIAIVALLIAISLPSMSGVREQARRVVCGANLRSVGQAVLTYASENDEHVPSSVFLGNSPDGSDDFSAQMNHARVSYTNIVTPQGTARAGKKAIWDGLGVLFDQQHLSSSKVYYCPSHHGDNPYEKYADKWSAEDANILSNYQYRGRGANGVRRLDRMTATAAIVSDSLSSVDEYNHSVGTNVLRAGLAVEWIGDYEGNAIASRLNDVPEPEGGSVGNLWNTLDTDSKK